MGILAGTSFRGRRSTTSSSSPRRPPSRPSRGVAAALLGAVGIALLLVNPRSAEAQFEQERQLDARIDPGTGQALAIYRPKLSQAIDGTADEVVRAFLRTDSRIGWDGSPETLRLEHSTRSAGGSHLTYQQYVGDVPVLGAVTRVSLNDQLEPTFVVNAHRPDVDPHVQGSPTVDSGVAQETAAQAVELGDAAVSVPELAILPGSLDRLVWRIVVWPENGGEWLVLVDAIHGNPVRVEEMTLHRHHGPHVKKPGRMVMEWSPPAAAAASASATGRGLVFDPDPLATSGRDYAAPYVDGDDADFPELNAERIEVDLLDISQFADNRYRLAGPYVEIVGRRPFGATNYDPPSEADPNAFQYLRGDERFEAVMTYYHIDKSQRYVQELGFDNIQNGPLQANPFGEGNADASLYYTQQNFLSFGGGSVDDAEDAFVIWHEYAHALLNATVPNFLNSFEARSIHEGWADYWATSYQRNMFERGELPAGDWRRLFRWDGNNPPSWIGRQLPEFARYPDDLERRTPHLDGLVLASAFMAVWDGLGHEVTDQLALQSHFYLSNSALMPDVAEAFIQADIDLNGGANTPFIVSVFAERGFVDPEAYGPIITHEPLGDTEQVGGSIDVIADVSGVVSPIQTVVLHYTVGGESFEVQMTQISDDSYSASIPLPDGPAIVEYYISAVDDAGAEVGFPSQYPSVTVRFQAGPDTEAPTIEHVPIARTSVFGWPPTLSARIDDNIGVAEAYADYSIVSEGSGATIDEGRLELSGDGDLFIATFPELAGAIVGNELVTYRIVATDRSSAANQSALPETGQPAFEFRVSEQGTLADFSFESGEEDVTASGVWELGTPSFGMRYAHSGQNAWATRLDRAYPDFPGSSELVLPPLNLGGFGDVWLQFWHWYDIEHDGSAMPGSGSADATLWDGGVVQYSHNGGDTWITLTPEEGYDGIIPSGTGNPLENQEAYGGFSLGWRRALVRVPASSDTQIRFVFGHDISNNEESIRYAGWIVDDISIEVDRPTDSELPQLVEGPEPVIEAEAGSEFGPGVSLRLRDNVGIESVWIDYALSGPAGQTNGSQRLSQSGADPEVFLGRIPIPAGSTAPGSIVDYRARAADFDGNEISAPASGPPYRVEYVFVAREEQLTQATPSGGWQSAEVGWSLDGSALSNGRAALVLTPFDLPSDAADIRFEMRHAYRITEGEASVELTDDRGSSWSRLEPVDGYPAESGFRGESEIHTDVFDLVAFGGRQVQLRILLDAESPETADFWEIENASTVFKAEGDRFTIPRSLALQPNYPDPFRTSTSIVFTIPEPSVVTMEVYDVLGRRVSTIADEPMEAGTYTKRWDASGVAAGTYFLRLNTTSGRVVETLSVIK